MVFKGGVPMFHACSVDRHAATTILAVLAQQHGALGVIVEQSDRVYPPSYITFFYCFTTPLSFMTSNSQIISYMTFRL